MSEPTDFSSLVDENTKLRGQIRTDYSYLMLLIDKGYLIGEAVDMVHSYRKCMQLDYPWMEKK